METSRTPRGSIGRRSIAMLAVALVVAAYGGFASRRSTVTAQAGSELQGMGIVTGAVTAGRPFQAAHVYLRSTDRRRPMLYMVYTSAGAFKAVAVMPGSYELVVKGRGLESDPQPVVVKSGTNPALKVARRQGFPGVSDLRRSRGGKGVKRRDAREAGDHLRQLRGDLSAWSGPRRP
jgi:hypothetical protein